MVAQIDILPNGSQKILLLSFAKLIVVGFVRQVYPLILFGKFVIFVKIGMVNQQRLSLRMGFDRIGFSASSRFLSHNGYGSFGSKYILHKEGRLTDHRTPARLVPTHRTILKADLQLSVIVIVLGNFISELGADGIYLYRFGARHLTHYIDIMYPAIHNRTETFHQVSV